VSRQHRDSLLFLPLLLVASAAHGCVGTAENSYWISDESTEVTFSNQTDKSTFQVRHFSLTAEEDPEGARVLPAAAITMGTTLAIQGARMLYDYIVENLEEEAKKYQASYSAAATMPELYGNAGGESAVLLLSAAEMAEWFNSVPVPGAVPPATVQTAIKHQSAYECRALSELYRAVCAEWERNRRNGVLPKPRFKLKVTTYEPNLQSDGFTFTRRASQKAGVAAVDTIRIDGHIARVPDTNEAELSIDTIVYRATAAKIPSNLDFLAFIDDELQQRVDLIVSVRLERECVDQNGRLTRETILEEPVAQLNGIDVDKLSATTKLTGLPKVSRRFPLPEFLPSSPNAARLRLTVICDESNKAGDYLRKAVKEAKDHRDEAIERIEAEVKRLAKKLEEENEAV